MSFRFFQPGTQFFSNDGKVLAGGSLWFFDSGTSNPADTYSDPTLTTPNPNPVPLDGAGRPENDVWGDGSYRVVLKDAGGVTLVTMDNVSGPQGIPDPSLQSGKFLTNDGTDLSWAEISQVPNPAGEPNGNVLTTDGAGNIAWQPTGLANVRQVPDPDGVPDGWVLTRDDDSPGDYAWKAIPSAVGGDWSPNLKDNGRVIGGSYTNTSGRDLAVIVTAGGYNNGLVAQVDAATIATVSWPAAHYTQCLFFIVPPGKNYAVATSHGEAPALYTWVEKSL